MRHAFLAPRRAPQAGFSLIEVLLAVALLGGIGVGIMTFVGSSMKLNRLALERTTATELASARMELFKSHQYRPLADRADYGLPEETLAGSGNEYTLTTDYEEIPEYPAYRRVVTFTYELPVAGMMRVQVDIIWRNLSQGEKTHTMITYLHPDLERTQ